MTFFNWELASQPLNWLIVWGVVVGVLVVAAFFNPFGANQNGAY